MAKPAWAFDNRPAVAPSLAAMMRGLRPAFFLGMLTLAWSACYADQAVSQQRQDELVHLVRNDCGACHGMKLTGGLGPALLPASLRGKPAEALSETILRGRAGTAMPPWQGFLGENEAMWIVERLLEGFPDAY